MRERDDWDDDDYAEPASSYGIASRAVTQGFVGTAGSAWGHVETHCPGCLRSPWPDCACCGGVAIVALPDVETHHTLTLCGACWLLVLTVRMRPAPSHSHGRRLSALQLAEITFLREWARLPWHEIASLVGASFNGVYRAYHRRIRADGHACPPMLHSTPATTIPSPSVVPKTRRRPVAPSVSVPHPTTSEGRTPRASATPSSRRSKQVRRKSGTKPPQRLETQPLSASVLAVEPSSLEAGGPPSLMDVASERKYNMTRQGRSTGRRQHTASILAR